MRVIIDARMLYWTGVGRYTKALLDELEHIDHDNEYFVLMRRADFSLWKPSAANFKRMEVNVNPYTFAEQWGLYWKLRSLKPDLVHFTAPNAPMLYRRRRLVTIHDLTLLDFNTSRGSGFAKWLRGLKRLPFRLVLWNDVRSADGIMTVTEYVKRRLVRRFGTTDAKIHTSLLAADKNAANPESVKRMGDLGEYIFYVGNVYPYKNVGSTIRALAELRSMRPKLSLVIAGKRDAFTRDLELLADKLGLAGAVKFVGFVSDGELVNLYKGAAVYVNPSLSEGFGLQGLEAMTQEVPVVSSSATCLPEVYGDAAEYFDPLDVADQVKAIARVLNDAKFADNLIKAGRARVKSFSWRRMAEQTLAVYREIEKG